MTEVLKVFRDDLHLQDFFQSPARSRPANGSHLGEPRRAAVSCAALPPGRTRSRPLPAADTPFPPLRVWFDGSQYWLSDGFHRLAAAKRAGFKYVTASVENGSLEDAIWDSYGANSRHGLPRRRLDVIATIQRALLHPHATALSNVQIAKRIGIPETTLRRWRKRLSSPDGEDGVRLVTRKGHKLLSPHYKDSRAEPFNYDRVLNIAKG